MAAVPRIIAVDWSGAIAGSERTIYLAEVRKGHVTTLQNGRTREQLVEHLITGAKRDPHVIVGLDFAFSLPQWFLDSRQLSSAPELWDLAVREAEDWLDRCDPPFWGRPGTTRPSLPEHFRRADLEVPSVSGVRPNSVFQIGGAGSVGTGSLRGMPALRRLRESGFSVWPFDPPRLPLVVEIYPRILTGHVTKSSPEARAAYLTKRFPDLAADLRVRAATSDDAFDALLSAIEMAARVDELISLPEARDGQDLKEGRIWIPRTLPAPTVSDAPARQMSTAPDATVRAESTDEAAEIVKPAGEAISSTGVRIADDFRQNLLVDRFDPALISLRGSKRNAMRSENSEDVLTWNAFRALRRANASLWLPALANKAFGLWGGFAAGEVSVELWTPLQPPPALRRFQKDEGPTEVDVLIESDSYVWIIEAKLRSDISLRTTNNELRDQVLRNIDVGSYYAGVRPFYFSLLVLDRNQAGEGGQRVATYAASREVILGALPHRADRLDNVAAIGLLDWRDVVEVLETVTTDDSCVDAWSAASIVGAWLRQKVNHLTGW